MLSSPTAPLAPATCARCGQPRPERYERYCSPRCARIARRTRWRANRRAAGRPYCTPSKRRAKQRRSSPYNAFKAATTPTKRVQVPETAEAQRKAELLIARGCCAYRNTKGFIRDIGVPRKAEHRGKVWARPKEEVRAKAESAR